MFRFRASVLSQLQGLYNLSCDEEGDNAADIMAAAARIKASLEGADDVMNDVGLGQEMIRHIEVLEILWKTFAGVFTSFFPKESSDMMYPYLKG